MVHLGPTRPACPECGRTPHACVFCARIAHGEYTQSSVNSVVYFEPIYPVTPGHLLFVPMGHTESAGTSPWAAGSAVLAAGQYLARQHLEGNTIEANIITSVGPLATQTVWHLHVHLVPRREGDGLLLPWSVGQEH